MIAFSGCPDEFPFTEEQAKLAGADSYFLLPFKTYDFMEGIKKILERPTGDDMRRFWLLIMWKAREIYPVIY